LIFSSNSLTRSTPTPKTLMISSASIGKPPCFERTQISDWALRVSVKREFERICSWWVGSRIDVDLPCVWFEGQLTVDSRGRKEMKLDLRWIRKIEESISQTDWGVMNR
jgi:hypothetical protein